MPPARYAIAKPDFHYFPIASEKADLYKKLHPTSERFTLLLRMVQNFRELVAVTTCSLQLHEYLQEDGIRS